MSERPAIAPIMDPSRFDTIGDIEYLFPGRIEQHLELFVTLLHYTLVEFDG
ncbi:MAG: hypothetical protein JW726_17280 [Anaerolineales bacterium]|nr:hypothetical protein [Anaerolineales bacterium]